MKRVGRPRVDENDESAYVHLTLPARQYDQLYADAQRARCTVPELVRRRLRHCTDTDDDDDPSK